MPPPTPPSASEVDTTPKVVVENSRIHIHARPAELYLTADSSHGQINMLTYYDGNVFEEGVLREWLDEVREAVLWYLGRPHRAQQSPAGGDAQTGRGEGVQAKL